MKNRTLHYIIRFLVGDDVPSELVETIGYTADPNKFDRYNVVIIPSGFFDGQTYGTPASLPELPLQEVQGIPLVIRLAERGMDKRYMGGSCRYHRKYLFSHFQIRGDGTAWTSG